MEFSDAITILLVFIAFVSLLVIYNIDHKNKTKKNN